MSTLTEDAQVLWQQIQAEQGHDPEPQEISEAVEAAPVDVEPVDVASLASDAEPAVTQEAYIEALVEIAANLQAENLEIRRIAATALERAREVEQLRAMLGVTEPVAVEEDLPDLSEEFMAATAAAVEALRGEDAMLLGEVVAVRAELRELAESSRRRWWWR